MIFLTEKQENDMLKNKWRKSGCIMGRRVFQKFDGFKYGWLKNIKRFLLLLFFVFLLFHLLIGFSFIRGDSMKPTLCNGEVAVYTRIPLEYKRGDVVSIKIPSGEYYVKRVIAVEGETIDMESGNVYIDGILLEEPYTVGKTYEQKGIVRFPYTLREGQIFVMGDNREASMDSRSFGVVGTAQIKGKLWFHAGRFYIKKL